MQLFLLKAWKGMLPYWCRPAIPSIGFFGQRWVLLAGVLSLSAGFGLVVYGDTLASQVYATLSQEQIQASVAYPEIVKDLDVWTRASVNPGSWAESVGDSGQAYNPFDHHGIGVDSSLGIEVHQKNDKESILYPYTQVLQWNNQAIVVEVDHLPLLACSKILLNPILYQKFKINLPDVLEKDQAAILENNRLLMNEPDIWCTKNRSSDGDRIILTFPRGAMPS